MDAYEPVFETRDAVTHKSRMNYARILKEMLSAGELTQAELAQRVGVTQPTVSRWMKGQKPEIDQHRRIAREAQHMGLPNVVSALGGAPFQEADDVDEDQNTVPVKGWVGAGAQAQYFPEDADLDRAEAPQGSTRDTVALEIRGTSLGELFDRWLVFFDQVRSPVTSDLVGKLCVVGLPDGRVMVKKLKRAGDGLYDLLSNTEEPIRAVPVQWAAKVKIMAPR